MSNKILLVEDNYDTRNLLHHYFRNAGYTAIMAADGVEGFYLATAEKPDIILTDLAMPKMTGIDMIKALRQQPKTADIPILVFTARGSANVKEAVEAGADLTFYKPFDFDALVEVVHDLIEKSDEGLKQATVSSPSGKP